MKAVNKYGMKNVDENKRDTYNEISTSLREASVVTTLDDDLKQLTPVCVSELKTKKISLFVLVKKESDCCFCVFTRLG